VAWSIVWGHKPNKTPRGDGTALATSVFMTNSMLLCWTLGSIPLPLVI